MTKKKKYTNAQMGALADAFSRSVQTIERWVRNNDDRLESDKARKALAKIKPNK